MTHEHQFIAIQRCPGSRENVRHVLALPSRAPLGRVLSHIVSSLCRARFVALGGARARPSATGAGQARVRSNKCVQVRDGVHHDGVFQLPVGGSASVHSPAIEAGHTHAKTFCSLPGSRLRARCFGRSIEIRHCFLRVRDVRRQAGLWISKPLR